MGAARADRAGGAPPGKAVRDPQDAGRSRTPRPPHRVRERLVDRRTALINRIRGILLKRRIMVAKGQCQPVRACRRACPRRPAALRPCIRRRLAELRAAWRVLDARVGGVHLELVVLALISVSAVRQIVWVPARIASTMFGARKASGIRRLTLAVA